jgi:hypothetical protein
MEVPFYFSTLKDAELYSFRGRELVNLAMPVSQGEDKLFNSSGFVLQSHSGPQ